MKEQKKLSNNEVQLIVAKMTGNKWLDTFTKMAVQLVLANTAMQRLLAVCEIIRDSSFNYDDWLSWYNNKQKKDFDLEEFLSTFSVSVLSFDGNHITMIETLVMMYQAILIADVKLKEVDKREQFIIDYSRTLCEKELNTLLIKASKDKRNRQLLLSQYAKCKKIFRALYCVSSIKKIAIENEFVQMLYPARFRKSSQTSKDFEGRNPFESDYFRIVTSAPIRRLQDKTQIFPQEKSDFVRRRLTHSMEVAAIGRHLGLMVEEKLMESGALFNNGEYAEKYLHSIATILETAGLVHDIGNPPFGHFGEDTIKDYFKKLQGEEMRSRLELQAEFKKVNIEKDTSGKKKIELLVANWTKANIKPIDVIAEAFINLKEKTEDFTNFDGNVQGFRILRHLGLSTDHNSFNLTMPTLAAIIKYPFPSEHKTIDGNHSSKKCGYYFSEKEDYNEICKTLCLKKGKRHPLAYLLEAADDIVNVTSDVEDGCKMGIIGFEELRDRVNTLGIQELHFNTIKEYENEQAQKGGCPVEIPNELLIKEFRIRAVHYLMNEAVENFVNNIQDIIRDSYEQDEEYIAEPVKNPILGNELLDNSELHTTLSELQKETYQDTYVLKSELLGKHIITEMLNRFIGCMFNEDVMKYEENNGKKRLTINTKSAEGKLYALISSNYKRAFDCEENEVPIDPYQRFQLAVDHVSGMTDSYIVDLYNELTNRKR